MNSLSDKRKGFSYLEESLTLFCRYNPKLIYELVVFGESRKKESKIFRHNVRNLGVLPDDTALSLVYSAADVFVAPSLQENLANTVMESLSCGTPVVAFNIGGMPDMIEHQRNGYLAQSCDTDALARGIEWVLSDENRWKNLSFNAREKVLNSFDSRVISKRYFDLYNKILRNA